MSISTRSARLIRTGINARCTPYLAGGSEERGYYSELDFARLWDFGLDWERFGKTNRLARAAYMRTPAHTRTWADHD